MQRIIEKLILISQESDCPRAQCAAIAITDDDTPDEVMGYNHHIDEDECVIENNHCVAAIHAEVDMVASAAQNGVCLKNATVVSLQRPCSSCLKAMSEAGVSKVFYVRDYHSEKHSSEYCSPKTMKRLGVEQHGNTNTSD